MALTEDATSFVVGLNGTIGVGAQSTLGRQDIFARKYIYENFIHNDRILHDICPKKYFFLILLGAGVFPAPLSYAYGTMSMKVETAVTVTFASDNA